MTEKTKTIGLFDAMHYEMNRSTCPEIAIVTDSIIEKTVVNKIPCSEYRLSAEGFFRFMKRTRSTAHTEYLHRKTLALYDVVKDIGPDAFLFRVDYLLTSGLMVGVYIREDSRVAIGSILGYRARMLL